VSALNVMFATMNSPSQLDGWKSSGGDPCHDSWKGISCSGSKVTEIDLSGLGLTGSIGYMLSDLKSVVNFDVSKNKFKSSIPYQLPPNVQRIDLSGNEFQGTVPYSISEMSHLKQIYFSNNKLNGQLNDMFVKLTKLTDLDLSFNLLSGDLPHSFMNLSSLSMLNLQNNKFSGTIDVLTNLPLDDLNIENNNFTGSVPGQLMKIKKIKVGGNNWSYDPGNGGSDSTGLSWAAIAGIILCSLIVIGLIITLFTKRSSSSASHLLEEDRLSQDRPFAPFSSRELSGDFNVESRVDSVSSFGAKNLSLSPSLSLRNQSLDPPKSFNNNENAKQINAVKQSAPSQISPYPLVDLEAATGNFSNGRLLGEGTIGCVYRAKYADGKVVAVKKIDPSIFQGEKDDAEFEEIVSSVSKIHHPNISPLVGFCTEKSHKMLVYDYFRNGSLHEFLHLSDDFSKPLTWNTRVKIALGTAHAVKYLHEVCSPPCVHKNIKSSNILLDAELNPCLSDCGFGNLYERRSQTVESGYGAPECIEGGVYGVKTDVYSFGVVMLELMTGRMPMDGSKPKSEQCLVRWASPQLHDLEALSKMADPAMHGLYPHRSLSALADIIAQCIQSESEFRPPISQVVNGLTRLAEAS
ncbi:hypothetical protein M569_06686, partial [Genlisea aurea]